MHGNNPSRAARALQGLAQAARDSGADGANKHTLPSDASSCRGHNLRPFEIVAAPSPSRPLAHRPPLLLAPRHPPLPTLFYSCPRAWQLGAERSKALGVEKRMHLPYTYALALDLALGLPPLP
eukprot:7178771-Pyramimonas_sp.AAC.1